ncbi:uncharacterized protein [Ambystoma mexicanum]|uniref:uncharacterized protein isoform X2 n=1 Tax=Ambystoma mexicanum TaxID=8296 RepID=UPI0037E81B0D
MATSLQPYTRSSLPSLLDRYPPSSSGSQVSKKQRNKSREHKHREASHELSFLEDGEGEKDSRKSLMDERHLETYWDMHRLRNAMYVQYMELLNKKVEKQRIRIQMCEQHFKAPLEQPGDTKGTTERQLPFIKLSHDLEYMESVPKSSNYLIIGLQNELARRGALKSRGDFEAFHQLIQAGGPATADLKETLQGVKLKVTACKSSRSFCCGVDGKQQQASDQSTRKAKGQLRNSPFPGASLSQPLPQPLGKHGERHEETRKTFPKLLFSQLPRSQLKPQQKNMAREDADPLRPDGRNLRHEMYLRQLRQMYHVSLSNVASSRRLLEKNSLFADFEDENSVHNLVSYLFPQKNKEPESKHHEERRSRQKRHNCQASKGDISEGTKENSEQTLSEDGKPVDTSRKSTEDRICVCSPSKDIVSIPLSIEEIALKNPTMEAKKASSNWTNYIAKENRTCDVAVKRGERDDDPSPGNN